MFDFDADHEMNGCFSVLARYELKLLPRGKLRRSKPIPPAPIDSPFLTAREAAAYLRVSYGTFRNWATQITRTRHGRYRREDLDRFAQRKRK